ncbi:hypothetical protein P3T26_003347 [Streptomyces sp. MAA16]|nr:hypothetical protein [Streptomyces sp. MAA16]
MGRRHGRAVVVSGAAVALLCGMPGARAANAGAPPAAADGPVGAAVAGRRPVPDDGGLWPALPGLAVGLGLGAGGTLLMRRAAAGPGAGPPHGRRGERGRQPRSISG